MEQLGLWQPGGGAEVPAEAEYGPPEGDRPSFGDDFEAMGDDRPPMTDGRIPMADHRAPNADDRTPIADDRPPIGDARAPVAATPESVARTLSRYTGRGIRCTFTHNRSTMISYRERPGGSLDIRLHHMFLDAPDPVLAALAVFLTGGDRRAAAVIDGFIRARQAEVPPPDVRCVPQGRFHDLRALFDRLNATYFHGACVSRITWGSAGSRRYRRSIQLGCYVRSESLIRVHPCLDQAFVPEFYVAWIVFHEMLHEVFGVERHGGRHSVHPPEFVAIEQTYPDYARCKAWEEQNLPRLLRFRPSANRFGVR